MRQKRTRIFREIYKTKEKYLRGAYLCQRTPINKKLIKIKVKVK